MHTHKINQGMSDHDLINMYLEREEPLSYFLVQGNLKNDRKTTWYGQLFFNSHAVTWLVTVLCVKT